MRDVGYSGGGIGGGYSSAQILYNVKYRCSACEAQWTSTITETR
jgi:hypothetical protein